MIEYSPIQSNINIIIVSNRFMLVYTCSDTVGKMLNVKE